MKNIIFILFTYFCLPSFGGIEGGCQPNRDQYRDQKWLFGYESENHSQIPVRFGNSILDFSTEPPNAHYEFMPMDFNAFSSSLCDTLGNLVCYTNGIYIADKTHQKMINGDSLDYGQFWEDYEDMGGAAIQGGVTFLPVGSKKESAVLIYPDFVEFPNTTYSVKGINAAFIDLKRNNGKGVVLQKNISILIQDSLGGYLTTSCRHANGRDWWYISPRYSLNKYYRTLFSPYGIQSFTPQIMPRANNFVNFYGQAIVACFSQNGQRYAHHNPQIGTFIYDFDRCTGLLSNRFLVPLHRTFQTLYCGIAFSPNSQYLYTTDGTQIVQYDMENPNIPASGIVVAEYDGFIDSLGGNTTFFLLQNAPNSKIYGNCHAGNRYLHIIHNPNERGLACNVEQHGLCLPTKYNFTMPNFPYFRLGAEPGTLCDSLGIETGVTTALSSPFKGGERVEMHVSPNPTSGECVLSVMPPPLGEQRGEIRLLSLDGKVLETFFNPFLNQTNFTINLKNYAKGVYIAEYIIQDGGSVRKKIVRQ